jgi:hypothetical protein
MSSRPAAAAQTALAKALSGVKSAAGRGSTSGGSTHHSVSAAAASSASSSSAAAAAAAEISAKAAEAVFAEFYTKQMDMLQVRFETCSAATVVSLKCCCPIAYNTISIAFVVIMISLTCAMITTIIIGIGII